MPDTKKWFAKEKENNRALEAKPREVPIPKGRNIVCMCILHTRGEKGRSISCRREEKWGGEQGWGGKQKEIPAFRLQRSGWERQQVKEMLCCYYCMEITAARRNPGQSVAEYNFKKTASLKSWAAHGCWKVSAVVGPTVLPQLLLNSEGQGQRQNKKEWKSKRYSTGRKEGLCPTLQVPQV